MFDQTPVVAPKLNVRLKLENLNPGGSHKARAARRILKSAIASGELTPGGKRRILEKSGGNFGIGLALEAAKYDINVDLVIGLSFSSAKKKLCSELGAHLIGQDLLALGWQPKQIVEKIMSSEGSDYYFTDQFSNPENYMAHRIETGPELSEQVCKDINDYDGVSLVLSAGTGAHAAAISNVLQEQYNDVRLVIVEPENCSFEKSVFYEHSQLGAAVGAPPPFLPLSMISAYLKVSDQNTNIGQKLLAHDLGFYAGPTSGANYFAARQEATLAPHRLIISMVYDFGDAYLLS